MIHWDKKVLAVMMEWDYGIRERGVSIEKHCFYNNIKTMVSHVEPFWIDDYLNNTKQLQIDLLIKAKEFQPDLIFFIPYTNQFSMETLRELKENFTTYAWFGDDQWRYDTYSSKYAPYFTYISTTDPWSVYKYKKIGVEPILTEWAAQPNENLLKPLEHDGKYEYDVTFIGGINHVRKWFISQLSKKGINVECFGSGWSNGRVSYQQMEHIFRKSKINLNLSNSIPHDIRFVFGGLRNLGSYIKSSKRAEQVKARNFEIPLAGGFQLTNYVLGLERHWNIGKEIAVYNTVEECTQQIMYYLDNEDQRKDIVSSSQNRAINEHTYVNRLENILGEIWL